MKLCYRFVSDHGDEALVAAAVEVVERLVASLEASRASVPDAPLAELVDGEASAKVVAVTFEVSDGVSLDTLRTTLATLCRAHGVHCLELDEKPDQPHLPGGDAG